MEEKKEPINSINVSSTSNIKDSINKDIKREQEFATLLFDLKKSK